MDWDGSTPTTARRSVMARCARCCLHKSMKMVNLILLFLGIGIITYSLWLDKKWHECIAELELSSPPPRPWPLRVVFQYHAHARKFHISIRWPESHNRTQAESGFIYTCSGVGIAVSLSTLCCYMSTNSSSKCSLWAYIVIICCLLLLEVSVIIKIFFKMDFVSQVAAITDQHHTKLLHFVSFQLKLSRAIVLSILVVQINAVAFGMIIRPVPMECCNVSNVSPFTQSFLVPSFPELNALRQACGCRRCENLQE